jgi:hypothetical protein
MSEPLNVEEILGKAIEEEKQYEWLKAADYYQKILTAGDESDFLRKGEVRESLAHAIYKAALQADTSREFKERMTQTVAHYEEAKQNYDKSSDPGRVPRISRCEAMTALAAYWLAMGASEKKKSIDECWRLANEALRAFKETGDAWEYGKTYDQLSKSVSFGIDLDWNCQTRKKTLEEAVEHGEQAIRFLSSFEDSEELARAYVLVAIHQEPFSDNFLDGEQKKSGYQKAAEYWRKACQISDSTAVIEYFSSVSTLSGLSGWQTNEGDFTEGICEKALKLGKKAKDRFIIGGALDRLVYITYWKAYATDDPDERMALYRKALQYAEEAKSQFSISLSLAQEGAHSG